MSTTSKCLIENLIFSLPRPFYKIIGFLLNALIIFATDGNRRVVVGSRRHRIIRHLSSIDMFRRVLS